MNGEQTKSEMQVARNPVERTVNGELAAITWYIVAWDNLLITSE